MIDIDSLIKEMDNVPFGNSRFQVEHFTGGQEAPERRYRHVLLQLRQKISALKTAEFLRDRIYIDIDEIHDKIESMSEYDQRRARVDLDEKHWILQEQETLIKDAMIEIENYMRLLETLPKPTRDEFESAELGYWRKRLIADAKLQYQATGRIETGTLKSLSQVNVDVRQEITAKGEAQIRFIDTDKILTLVKGESE